MNVSLFNHLLYLSAGLCIEIVLVESIMVSLASYFGSFVHFILCMFGADLRINKLFTVILFIRTNMRANKIFQVI